MKKSRLAANPAEYLAGLDGWQAARVRRIRAAVLKGAKLDEQVKWGNLVYFANGPAIVIRAEAKRVLFGFWRGRRLRDIEPRLKPGGKYEMATIALLEGDSISEAVVRRLTRKAAALNRTIGDPTAIRRRS